MMRHEDVGVEDAEGRFVNCVRRASRVTGERACHRWKAKQADGRLVLQGGVRRAAWLRRFATIKIRVQIPEGVIGVKPMPKAGLESRNGQGQICRRIRVSRQQACPRASRRWRGAAASSPDDNYDEFVISTFLTDGLKPNTTLYFPVVQECEQGISRWIDIPAEGRAGA